MSNYCFVGNKCATLLLTFGIVEKGWIVAGAGKHVPYMTFRVFSNWKAEFHCIFESSSRIKKRKEKNIFWTGPLTSSLWLLIITEPVFPTVPRTCTADQFHWLVHRAVFAYGLLLMLGKDCVHIMLNSVVPETGLQSSWTLGCTLWL